MVVKTILNKSAGGTVLPDAPLACGQVERSDPHDDPHRAAPRADASSQGGGDLQPATGLIEQQRRLFDDARDIGEEAARHVTVDHAMVERGAERRHESRAHLAVDDPRLLLNRAEGHDRDLAGVQDRRAGIHAEDTDVGDRDRAVGHVGGL